LRTASVYGIGPPLRIGREADGDVVARGRGLRAQLDRAPSARLLAADGRALDVVEDQIEIDVGIGRGVGAEVEHQGALGRHFDQEPVGAIALVAFERIVLRGAEHEGLRAGRPAVRILRQVPAGERRHERDHPDRRGDRPRESEASHPPSPPGIETGFPAGPFGFSATFTR
jgi:hypothetical protein